MPDARWNHPRDCGDLARGDERARTYDDRDRDDHDPHDAVMHDLDLPRGEERELVVDRDCVYELNGEDSRRLVTAALMAPAAGGPDSGSTLGHAVAAVVHDRTRASWSSSW